MTIISGVNNQVINGTSLEDAFLIELSSNNLIDAKAGDDFIAGKTVFNREDDAVSFNNTIHGGQGNDRIYILDNPGFGTGLAEFSDSDIYGDAGDDLIRIENLQHLVSGGSGNDKIETHSGGKFLGGSGNDLIQRHESDFIDAPLGNTLNATIVGGSGADTLTSFDDATALFTDGQSVEFMYGEDGQDVLLGYGGNDMLSGGNHKDTVRGGNGNDTVRGDGGDDYLAGENDHDLMFGGTGRDTLYGGHGDDTINGGADRDVVYGGEHDDLLNGGNGDDYLSGGNGDDYLSGGQGNDALFGDSNRDTLYGNSGNDMLDGGINNDTLNGDSGDDSINGGADNDLIFGGSGDDMLDGESENDTIYGEAGDDYLVGYFGKDRLYGGAGNDTLQGSLEFSFDTDTMTGGSGEDTFLFIWQEQFIKFPQSVLITDFEQGLDKIRVEGDFTFADAIITDDGVDDSTVTFGNPTVDGLTIHLDDVTGLDASDFIF